MGLKKLIPALVLGLGCSAYGLHIFKEASHKTHAAQIERQDQLLRIYHAKAMEGVDLIDSKIDRLIELRKKRD